VADQGKSTRAVVALSSVVVAVCAIVVTVDLTSAADPPRVLDQESVERQASAAVRGSKSTGRDGVACPTSIQARKGTRFECAVFVESGSGYVVGEVTDDQGEIHWNKP